MVDDFDGIRNRRMAEAIANMDEARGAAHNAMDSLYANPRGALNKMQAYSKKHGDAALVKKLEADPAYFGIFRGRLGSGTEFSLQGFKERAVSKEFGTKISALVKSAVDAENKVLDIERGYSRRGPSGPDRDKDGPDL